MSPSEFVWCYFYKCPEVVVRARQPTEDHHLVVVAAGTYAVEIDGVSVQAQAGDMVLLRDGTSRLDWNVPGEPLEFFVVVFRWQALPADWPLLLRDGNGRVRLLAQWLHERWWWDKDFGRDYANGILQAILAEYRHAMCYAASDFIEQVRSYIREHLDDHVCVASLARRFGMSRATFSRRFQAENDVPPMQEVRRIRVAYARQLLQTTDLPLKAIAAAIGLADQVSLAHFFRKYVGISPGEMRRCRGETRDENPRHPQGLNRL